MGQHYVPRKYLRGFCNPKQDGLFWQYDKQEDRFAQVSVVTAANEKGFYSDEIERLLAERVEQPANQAIEKLRQRQAVSPAERAQLAFYIATMLKRVPRHRAKYKAMIPQVLEETIAKAKEMLKDAAAAGMISPDQHTQRIAETDIVAERFRLEPPEQVIEQIETPWPTPEMVELIFVMTWRLCLTRGPSLFLTSDNPAYYFEHCGMKGQEAELVFPIASDLALHGSWQSYAAGEPQLRILRQSIVGEFNHRLASVCHRFVYYPIRTEWIRTIVRKREPFLNLIRWY
jgi:DNA-binding transcriptional MerR regulator